LVLTKATKDATGKSKINNSCSSLSSQFHKKKFFEIRMRPTGTSDAECPGTDEIKPDDWRNDYETRLEDFSRIGRKSVIKAAQFRDEFKEYFRLKQG
jgi:hypothetical protein